MCPMDWTSSPAGLISRSPMSRRDCRSLPWKLRKLCVYDETNYTLNPSSTELNREIYSKDLDIFWKNRTETWVYANLTRQYTLSFYWSFMTLTTLGEQPSPITVFQFLYETMDILIGLLVFATIIGNVGSIVSNLNAQKADFDQMLDGVKQYMTYRQVNPEIQSRVISWFGYVWSQGNAVDDDAVISQLPTRIHGELAVHVHLDTLKRVKIFQDCEPGLLYELVLKLKLQVFSPSDYICRKGDIGKEMYIVKRGSLNVVSEDGSIVFVTLAEGAVFGELSILDIPGNKNGNKRTAAVRSVGYSDLFVLSKDDLWDALREYPEARKMLLAKGKELLKKDGLLLYDHPEDDQIGLTKTLDQKCDHLGAQLGKLDKDIAMLEKQFQTSSADNKQRITRLERIFSDNKKQIKRDCLLGVQVVLSAEESIIQRVRETQRFYGEFLQ
uniref:Cyclic nucleotide-binding domain-containing protein n=1 Tax=Plectus sambesii TaxID=2011161 RepID=A0A914UKF8_9BILA